MPSLLLRAAKSDVVFSWFALGYATAAAALSRLGIARTVLVTGGWDVAVVPEISYGLMLTPRRRWKIVAALSLSNRVLAISQSIAVDIRRWAPRSRVTICPLGFDTETFRPEGPKEQKVVTVGNVTRENLHRKGLDTFLKAASLMPDVTFVLIGGGEADLLEEIRSTARSNLQVLGFIPKAQLVRELQSAKVYAQLSAHEGFGCALAEAMLCGCLPVVTNRGAIPEVVGNTGAYVPLGDANATVEALRHALSTGDGEKARNRIRTKFPLEARKRALIEIVDELLDKVSKSETRCEV